MWVRITRRVPVEHAIPQGVTLQADPWPFPHAAVYDAEAERFRSCVKVTYAGQDVRLWPEEYEEVAGPSVIAAVRFVGLDQEED